MLTIACAMLLQADAAALDDPAKEIQWARSFAEAYEQARVRNVPVFIFLTSDN
jgi:hypothetical protein